MSRTLQFGFVGAGEIAVASAAAMRGSNCACLVRVVDTRADLASDLAATYGGQAATSIEELVGDPAVEAVYICTPHFLHKGVALQAAQAGKHVFVEKPMGVSSADAWEIVAACRQNGVACGIPFVVRYAPAYREAHRLVRAGAIGRVTGFRLTYRDDKPRSYWNGGFSNRSASDWRQLRAKAGGGVMIMNTIHDLDAALWITGLDVQHVQGVISNTNSPGEVEDCAHALFTCSGGTLASLEAHAALAGGEGPSVRWVNRIYGSDGQLLLPSPWGQESLALFTRDTATWQEVSPEPTDARRLAFDDFAAAIIAERAVPVPGEAGAIASTIIHAIYDAARRGERVAVHMPNVAHMPV